MFGELQKHSVPDALLHEVAQLHEMAIHPASPASDNNSFNRVGESLRRGGGGRSRSVRKARHPVKTRRHEENPRRQEEFPGRH